MPLPSLEDLVLDAGSQETAILARDEDDQPTDVAVLKSYNKGKIISISPSSCALTKTVIKDSKNQITEQFTFSPKFAPTLPEKSFPDSTRRLIVTIPELYNALGVSQDKGYFCTREGDKPFPLPISIDEHTTTTIFTLGTPFIESRPHGWASERAPQNSDGAYVLSGIVVENLNDENHDYKYHSPSVGEGPTETTISGKNFLTFYYEWRESQADGVAKEDVDAMEE